MLSMIGRHLVTSLGTVLTVVALFWTVAKPHAQDFVRETVALEKFASQRSLDAIDGRTALIETQIESMRVVVDEQVRIQSVIETRVNSLKELGDETRGDVKDVLKAIGHLRNDLQ